MAKKVPENFGGNVVTGKCPIVPSRLDIGDNAPLWRIRYIDIDGPWSWRKISGADFLNNVLPKMRNFESMTWNEILGRNSHEVRVADISEAAKKQLRQLRLDDIENLVSLRLTGKERIWGIKIQQVFYILWWDPLHQVYPSNKKHT